eukprot:4061462-Pyramimonas_sp.AAC.1
MVARCSAEGPVLLTSAGGRAGAHPCSARTSFKAAARSKGPISLPSHRVTAVRRLSKGAASGSIAPLALRHSGADPRGPGY